MTNSSSPLNASPEDLKLGYMRDRYGLTPKQAAYAIQVIERPNASDSERARAAGFSDGARTHAGGAILKVPKIGKAVNTEREEIERRARSLVGAIETDARGAIRGELAKHAENPRIAPNQTRALELLGKMEGVFLDRLEIDPGEHTRSRFADELIIKGEG